LSPTSASRRARQAVNAPHTRRASQVSDRRLISEAPHLRPDAPKTEIPFHRLISRVGQLQGWGTNNRRLSRKTPQLGGSFLRPVYRGRAVDPGYRSEGHRVLFDVRRADRGRITSKMGKSHATATHEVRLERPGVVRHRPSSYAFRDRAAPDHLAQFEHPQSSRSVPASGQKSARSQRGFLSLSNERPFWLFRVRRRDKADPQCHPVLRPLAPALSASTGSETMRSSS